MCDLLVRPGIEGLRILTVCNTWGLSLNVAPTNKANLSELINFYPPLKSPENLWPSGDFWGNRG